MSTSADTPPSSPAIAPFNVEGEIDVATAPELGDALRSHVESTTGDVVLDCSAMTFIDSSGIALLIRLAHKLRSAQRNLILVNVNGISRRAMELTGAGTVLQIDE